MRICVRAKAREAEAPPQLPRAEMARVLVDGLGPRAQARQAIAVGRRSGGPFTQPPEAEIK